MTEVSFIPRSRGWRRPGPWLLAGLLLGAAAIPGGLAAAHVVRLAPTVGYGRPEAGTTANFTNVQMTDRPSYDPRTLNVTGATGTIDVNVYLNNTASHLAHTFTLVNENQSGIPINRSYTPSELSAYFVADPPTFGLNVSAGGAAWANFSLAPTAKPLSLEFVSTIPYQFQAGMYGFLNITPSGPKYLVQENTTNSFQFLPNELSSPVGATGVISFDVKVTNLGNLIHTFTVSAKPNATFSSVGSFLSGGLLVNTTIKGGTGVSAWANFTVPALGVYEYICTEPGHFAQGMFGFLYVGVAVPPPPAVPSTAIVAIPILVGSALLLGVGLFLTLSAAFVGRFPKPPASGHH